MTLQFSGLGQFRRGFVHRSALLFAVAAAGLWLAGIVQASAQAPTSHVGTSNIGPGTILNSLNALPALTVQEAAIKPQPLKARTGLTAGALTSLKTQAAAQRFSIEGAQSLPPVAAATDGKLTPSADANFLSADLTNCFCAPADQALAVGDTPNGVLQAYNTGVSVFSKAGVLQPGFPKSFTTFFGLSASTPTTDPRAIFDWVNHRYYLLMIDFSPNQTSASHYNLAVSAGDDPTGGWCLYTGIPVQSLAPSGGVFPLPDFPRMGQDRQAIYIASNLFRPGYVQEEWLVFPKAQLQTCSGFGFQTFFGMSSGGQLTDTTQPVNVFNPSDNPKTEFLITSYNIFFNSCSGGCNGLTVWGLYGNVGSQTLTGVVVGTTNNYSLPPSATQPGGANSIDTNDTRISGMAMYSAGSIYASINTNGGSGQPGTIQYQVQPFTNPSTGAVTGARVLNEVVQAGASSWYYATQQPDGEGNVITVFNFSNASSFAGLAYGGRRTSEPVGALPDGGFFLRGGQAFYADGRWGDYTAVAPAGIAAFTGSAFSPVMWFAGMFANSAGNWQTAIGRDAYRVNTDQ